MNLKTKLLNAHLLLGISQKELKRRLALGLIDPLILISQLEQSSLDTQLAAASEKALSEKSLEQVDSYQEYHLE